MIVVDRAEQRNDKSLLAHGDILHESGRNSFLFRLVTSDALSFG
jgi:hypothetical protein